jgi:hypothetical protein
LGEAKTRLARDIGAARASAIYRALVEHQAAEIPLDWRVTVYFAPRAGKVCRFVSSGRWWTSTMAPPSMINQRFFHF